MSEPEIMGNDMGKRAVAVRQATEPAPADALTIVSVIERAARDPNVDVEKMHRLLEMHERVLARKAEGEYRGAMKECQAEMRPVARDCENPQTHSRYASYSALDEAVRPVYSRHGFTIDFNTADGAPADYVRVIAIVAHVGGHKERYQIDMPADGKGARGSDVMTRTHATGSAVTYGRRYLMQMIFNIATRDDDGNGAGPPPEKITEGQVANLQRLLNENSCDRAAFLKWAKVAQLSDIQARFYESCVDAIKRAGRNRK